MDPWIGRGEPVMAPLSAQPRWIAPALVLLALSFQLQATLPIAATGLRVSAADLVAPVLFVAALVHLQRTGFTVPRWRVPGLWLWLVVLSAWMVVALLRGRWFTGEWLAWAVVNKFLGWFVLLGFLLLGAWVGGVLARGARDTFMRALFVSGWTIAAISIALFALSKFGLPIYPDASSPAARLEGLLANPNAYGYFVAVLIALQAPYLARRRMFSLRVHRIGLALAVVALVLSGSRTAWLGAGAALAALWWLRALDLRELARAAAIAAVVVAAIYFGPPVIMALLADGLGPGDQLGKGVPTDLHGLSRQAYILRGNVYGFEARLAAMRAAFEAWQAHPVLGVGLGGFLWGQLEAGVRHVTLIHTTAQWLLTETGAVGLLLFAAFFLRCLRALWGAVGDGGDDTFRLAVLGAVFAFLGASLGMEALYQRHLWFLLGAALAVPAPGRGPARAS